ncbi:MAG TPA: hypothetical protein DIS94_03465 [Bacteroidetes bacterium]|nr:hypothetical protein [Bacteroidota bacterium]
MYELSEIGKWDLVLTEPNNLESDALDSQQEAVHMCLLPTSIDGNIRVLYFAAYEPESEGQNFVIKTRILRLPNTYDPSITSQIIPNWPGETDLPRLFCCGHTYLQNGKLLCAGGHRETPPPHGHFGLGLRIAYVFEPATETWDYLRNNDLERQLMNDGRWYPTVTNLGPVSDNRPYTALVVAGYRYELDGEMPVYNDDVEVFNPETGWIMLNQEYPQAIMPEDFKNAEVNYPGAHLIPFDNPTFGILKGEVFYSFPLAKKW